MDKAWTRQVKQAFGTPGGQGKGQIRPHHFVGAGRARGGAGNFRKNIVSHIALLGGANFWSPGVLRFAVPAMGISFLEMYFWMIFGYALPFLPWRLAFWRRFWFLTGFACYFLSSRATGESVSEV